MIDFPRMLVDLIIFLKRHPVLKFLLRSAFVAGLGICGAFAMTPASLWPLIFIALSGFYIYLSWARSAGQAFLMGFFFSIGYFTTGLWWVGNALLVEGNEYAWVWPISVIGLPCLLSIFPAFAVACAYIIAPLQKLSGFFAFVGCLALSEWVRGHIFTGFPWNLYGYSWAEFLPLVQSVSLFGSYGLTLMTIFWAVTAGFLIIGLHPLKYKIIFALVSIASFALLYAYGTHRLNTYQTVYRSDTALRIVQPNIPQADKWKAEKIVSNFEKQIALSKYDSKETSGEVKAAKNHIVIWPETAIASVLAESQAAREQISLMLETYPANATLLSGALLRHWQGEEKTYTNSLVVINTQGKLDPVYHKSHLVPFGEFIPFQDYIPLKPVAAFQGFTRGRGAETFFVENIPAFSPLICYEIIFSGQAISKVMPPQWIVTVTNDAWYGDSAGPRQHFVHSIFRATEEGLPVVRAANTGISGLVDAYGRILQKAPLNENWTSSVLLPYPAETQTFFSYVGHFLFLTICSFMIAGGFIIRCRTAHLLGLSK